MGIILFNQMQKQNAMLMALLESFRPLMGIILFNLNALVLTYVVLVTSFRPLMGIILFNYDVTAISVKDGHIYGFRPLMGIILFNLNQKMH